jgi:hypothetical protein
VTTGDLLTGRAADREKDRRALPYLRALAEERGDA